MNKLMTVRYAVKVGDKYAAGVGQSVWLVDSWEQARVWRTEGMARAWMIPWKEDFPGLNPRVVRLLIVQEELELENEEPFYPLI